MLLLHQITLQFVLFFVCLFFGFLSFLLFVPAIYGCHCTDCGMFQCISLFIYLHVSFLCLVCFAFTLLMSYSNICNNVHYKFCLTFELGSWSVTWVCFVFVLC